MRLAALILATLGCATAASADTPSVDHVLEALRDRIARIEPCCGSGFPLPGYDYVKIVMKPVPTYLSGVCAIQVLQTDIEKTITPAGAPPRATRSDESLFPRIFFVKNALYDGKVRAADPTEGALCAGISDAGGVESSSPQTALYGFEMFELLKRQASLPKPTIPIGCESFPPPAQASTATKRSKGRAPAAADLCVDKLATLRRIAQEELMSVGQETTDFGFERIRLVGSTECEHPLIWSVRVDGDLRFEHPRMTLIFGVRPPCP